MKRKWIWLPICLLVLLVAAGAVFLKQDQAPYTLTLDLTGDTVMVCEKGQTFQDPGAWALGTDNHGNVSQVEVVCAGQVDTQVPGVYRLQYQAQFHDRICTAYRDVHVVESLDPVITLIADPDSYTLPGQPYQEEGFSATDWRDGDITGLVQRTEENGIVTYTVTSSTGRTATVQRVIRYDDPAGPELELLGGADFLAPAGFPFEDPGVVALDNADGDLTDSVIVEGSVDIYHPGIYPLTYSVTDSWGNTTVAVRNVRVEPTLTNPSISTGKVIYLTFDDGPGNHTGRLLDILAKYDVKATFFMNYTGAIGYASRIAAEGHAIGNHTASHNFAKIYSSEEAFWNDLYYMQSVLKDLTGQTTYLVRFPGGTSNSVSKAYNQGIMTRLAQQLRDQGYRYFDWNVDSNDAGGATTAEEVFYNVTSGISGRKTAVVLQHDVHGFSVDAVESIIIWGLANGYTFLPLDMSSPGCAHSPRN